MGTVPEFSPRGELFECAVCRPYTSLERLVSVFQPKAAWIGTLQPRLYTIVRQNAHPVVW